MARALDRPDPRSVRMALDEAQRLRVTACVRAHRSLRDDRPCRCDNHSEHVLVAVRVDADHVVHLICKHPL